MSDKKLKGDWGVVVRVPQEDRTFKAFFLDGIDHIDEKTARVAFGLAIRAGELEIPIEGLKINAVRLLRWEKSDVAKWFVPDEHNHASVQRIDESALGSWKVVQEHITDICEKWRNDVAQGGKPLPYREDCFHPGVPCMGGAWGSSTSCAMHWGLPLDSDGVCVEGRRGAKYLGLIVVPIAMQIKHDWPSMMTRRELDICVASARSELANRGDERVTNDELKEACEIFDREIELLTKEKKPAEFDTKADASHDGAGGSTDGKANGT